MYKRQGLDEQLEKFVREHSDTKLVIVDTLQKVREAVSDSYSSVSYTHLDVYKRQGRAYALQS